ncbi:Glycine oxidase [hydrothermal vent metagenome]|uniref:Glycine oxidase n=1 Tax=hydrothermal vent metagenome TaxID=652676 RepID=A0A3B0SKG5_9ZZZZ
MTVYDVIIIGAGIAGASIASEIAAHRSVVLLEAEEQPGYHATGRSAAFWTESYGGPQVQPLTTASLEHLANPPSDFSSRSFLKPRGAINIAKGDQAGLVDEFMRKFSRSGVTMENWDASRLQSTIAHLKPAWQHGVYEPDCCDIDVAGLHAAYLRNARKNNVALKCNTKVQALSCNNLIWNVETNAGPFNARTIVNAAGAWADEIAILAGVRPIGIQPMRRTMVQIKTDPPSSPEMALIVALDGSFYFKPEAGGSYWLSPHDEAPVPPGDVTPEELDVATAIDRFQSVLNVEVKSVLHKWAGLRSFAPDRLPVYGFDPVDRSFFWFAGQGGFGIQTAPAAAKLAKAILLDVPPEKSVQPIDAALYDASRFKQC